MPIRRLLPLLVVLACSACYKAGQQAPTIQTRTNGGGQPAIAAPELVSLTEALGDTFAITVAQATNQIQENATPDARMRAQRVKAFVGATAYSLAASPNPEIAMVDLVVNIAVQRRILGAGVAASWFGERGVALLNAYQTVEEAGWETLKRVYTEEQLGILRDAIERWLAANPNMTNLPFVRLPNLAKYRNVSLVSRPGSVRILSPVAEAAKTAMDLRLLGERSLYIGQRAPFLLTWYGEQSLYNVMATPESQDLIHSGVLFAASADRLSGALEHLPDAQALQATLGELNATLGQAAPLLGSVRGVLGDLNQALGATDQLLAPFQTRAVGGGPPERTFDVPQYTLALRELTSAARELNLLVMNGSRLVESPDLGERLNQVQGVTDASVAHVVEQGNRWIDRLFWRGVAFLALFFLGLLAYRVVSTWLVGKVRPQR